tara:strand:+ start:2211 stop:2792 length:582 start_codon:yes stop_codon:yes gene_type:complete
MKNLFMFLLIASSVNVFAFNASIETDPVFYLGAKNLAGAYDFNIDFKTDSLKQFRFGFFSWNAEMNQQMTEYLMTDNLKSEVQNLLWTGYGVELHYLPQGHQDSSLIFGLRLQNNSYEITTSSEKIKINHGVVTPQVGYQYFLTRAQGGFYLLPWIGAQIPISGDDKVTLNGSSSYQTRKVLPVITVHIGYEY